MTSMSPLFPFDVSVIVECAQTASPLLNDGEVEAVAQSLPTPTVALVTFASVNAAVAGPDASP